MDFRRLSVEFQTNFRRMPSYALFIICMYKVQSVGISGGFKKRFRPVADEFLTNLTGIPNLVIRVNRHAICT